MRLYFLILCLFSIEKTFSQIDILETKEKEYSKPPNYDSTYNSGSFTSIMRLTGQTIYFIPHSKKYNERINKYSDVSEFLTKKATPDFINRTPKITRTALESIFAHRFYPKA